jgi:dihydropteroate synthase
LVAQGADVLDVGGESTRPGADPVPPTAEQDRVVPVIEALAAETGVPVSVDTRRASVARAALAAGATIVNDVSAADDPDMLGVVASAGAQLVLMHMRGEPRTMQAAPRYDDVVAEVADHLAGRVAAAEAAGIERRAILVDPGIGFGKTLEHNLALLRGLERIRVPGTRVLLGASRKSFLGTITGRDVASERVAASLACAARALEAGVDAVRVHDVAETHDLLSVLARIRRT